jgi:hypothetical protein
MPGKTAAIASSVSPALVCGWTRGGDPEAELGFTSDQIEAMRRDGVLDAEPVPERPK